jgi:hypothetical protein
LNPPPQLPPLGPNEVVTWVRVERETFDIVGVLLTSLGFTGICVAFAAFFGLALGAARIIRGRRERQASGADRIGIHLAEAEPPA